jgi:hypothetical protein
MRPAEEVRKSLRSLVGAIRGEEGYQRKEGTDTNRLNLSTALVSALELSVKLREMGEDKDDGMLNEEEMLGMAASQLNEPGMIVALTQSRQAWRLLMDGAMVRLSGLDKGKVDTFAPQLEEAITERLEKGRQSPPARSIKGILEAIDTNTRTHPSSQEWYEEMEQPIPATILHPPASASPISDTEKRLGTTLPADYKEYLSIANGNEAAFGGIINEAPLLKCEDIRWISDNEDYFSDLTVDIPADMFKMVYELYDDALDWPKIGRSIIIGMEDVNITFLVPPEAVAEVKETIQFILNSTEEKVTEEDKNSVRHSVQDFAGSMDDFAKMDWCCVTMMDTEMRTHSSFKAYLRAVAESSRQLPKDCWNIEYEDFFAYRLVD